MINVASAELGSKVIYVTDDFFAKADRMLQESEAVFKDEYDDNGHWMDGWESRRRRDNGNDFCIVKLGAKAVIHSFLVDTAHFKGNYPLAISVKGCNAKGMSDAQMLENPDACDWEVLLEPSDLEGDHKHDFDAMMRKEVTHLRVDIYPDGGIARFKALGEMCFDERLYAQQEVNVASLSYGARAVYANNEFFGPLSNILKDTEAVNMGDGWETRRRRKPGYDWGIIALPKPAIIDHILVDTQFFKGNFADTVSLCGAYVENATDHSLITQSIFWEELLCQQKLAMDTKHVFDQGLLSHQKPVTHVRINIFPDGGISRLKLFGRFINETVKK